MDRIVRLARDVVKGCSFYRDLYEGAGVFGDNGVETRGLLALPFIAPSDLIFNPDGFRNRTVRPYRVSGSSGTTGHPKRLFKTRQDTSISVEVMQMLFARTGLASGDVLLIGQPFDLSHIGHITLEACRQMDVLAIPTGLGLSDAQMVDLITALGPMHLFTSPSRMRALIAEADRRRAPLFATGVMLAGEPCSPQTRRLIEQRLHLWPHDLYGSEETDGLAGSCAAHSGLHLAEEYFIFELIEPGSGHPATDERGELVVTSLYAEGTPLIRYRLGDVVEIDRTPCVCGDPSPRIQILGRVNEVFHLFDGITLHAYQIAAALKAHFGAIDRFQAVRETRPDGGDLITLSIDLQNASVIDEAACIAKLWDASLDLAVLRELGKLQWSVRVSQDFRLRKGRKTPQFIDLTRDSEE